MEIQFDLSLLASLALHYSCYTTRVRIGRFGNVVHTKPSDLRLRFSGVPISALALVIVLTATAAGLLKTSSISHRACRKTG